MVIRWSQKSKINFCRLFRSFPYWLKINSSPPELHTCVSKLGQHWFRLWFVAYTVLSHYPQQCWNTVHWPPRNKLQWNINRNTTLLLHKNVFDNVVYENTKTKIIWIPLRYYQTSGGVESQRQLVFQVQGGVTGVIYHKGNWADMHRACTRKINECLNFWSWMCPRNQYWLTHDTGTKLLASKQVTSG